MISYNEEEYTYDKIINNFKIDYIGIIDNYMENRFKQILEDVNAMEEKYAYLFDNTKILDMKNIKYELETIIKSFNIINIYRKNLVKKLRKSIKDSLKIDELNGAEPVSKDGSYCIKIISIDEQWKIESHIMEFLKEDDIEYEKLVQEYIKFQNIEDKLKISTVCVWQNELTQPNKYIIGKPFKFLVHSITKGDVLPEAIGDKLIISTSLITDKHLGIYGSQYGFVYPVYYENLMLMAKDDLYSVDLVENTDSLHDFIIHEQIDEEYFLSYMNQHSSKTMTPEQMEQDNILRNIEKNGEVLNNDTGKVYNEVLLMNNDMNRPIAVFCITNGDKEFSTGYQYAKQLAQEFKLELIEIDKTVYREKQNLPIITQKDKEYVIDNLLEKCVKSDASGYINMNNSISKFISEINNTLNIERKTIFDNEIFEIYKNIRVYKGNKSFDDYLIQEMKTITEKYNSRIKK